jgi:hypothetical protein
MVDIINAVHEDREVTISAESCGEAMKILNGIHWGGWNQREAFRQWAYLNFDLPTSTRPAALPTADDAKAQGWHGGELAKTLIGFVTDPEPTLAAPFLG